MFYIGWLLVCSRCSSKQRVIRPYGHQSCSEWIIIVKQPKVSDHMTIVSTYVTDKKFDVFSTVHHCIELFH